MTSMPLSGKKPGSSPVTPGRSLWLFWVASCLLILAVHSLTLTIDRQVNQDEVQILDLGRTVLNPSTDWALSWDENHSIAVLPIAYLGPVVQELTYQISAPSIVGPRLVAVFAALFAATALLGWLLARGVVPWFAVLLALAFLLDPMFADTYRQGRIDGWAIAAALFACWQLVRARHNVLASRPWKIHLILAAVAFTLSPFLWPSAPILAPLVALELWTLCRAAFLYQGSRNWRLAGDLCLYFCATCCLALLLLLIPIATHWEAYWLGIQSTATVQAAAAIATQIPVLQLFAVYDPLILIAGLLALVMRRDWGLLLAFLIAVAMIHLTMIYQARVIYLLPYIHLAIAIASKSNASSHLLNRFLPVMHTLVAACFVWGVVSVLVLRPIHAFLQGPANDLKVVNSAFERVIGAGPKNVLVEEWSAYYAGRDLNWKIYFSLAPLDYPDYVEFIQKMDYAIVRESPIIYFKTNAVARKLEFEEAAVVHFPEGKPLRIPVGVTSFVLPASQYPSVRIYRNPDLKDRENPVAD